MSEYDREYADKYSNRNKAKNRERNKTMNANTARGRQLHKLWYDVMWTKNTL